jgi:hypothetical protein
MASIETVGMVFKVLMARWPKYPVNDKTVEVYHQCLQDMPDDILQHAVVQYMKTEKWFPGVSELRDVARTLFGAKQLDPEEAWAMVTQWRKHPRRAQLPPEVKEALRVLSTPEYSIDAVTEMSDRARFCARFKAMSERVRFDEAVSDDIKQLAEEMRMERQIEEKRERVKQLEGG